MENKERTQAENTVYTQYVPKDMPFYRSDGDLNIPVVKTPGGTYIDILKGSEKRDAPEYDMDGDGDLDAATCGYGDKEVWWFENKGKGRFENHLVARDQEAYDIRATDLDRDGDFDLLIAGRGRKNVTWYANPAK